MSFIYMKAKGLSGDVTTKNYEGWIDLVGLNFGVSKHSAMKAGNMADRSSSLPEFSELRIKKRLDSSSNDLFSKSCGDKATPEVEIHYFNSESTVPDYKLLLNDVLFTEHSMHIYEGVVPFESVKLNYAKIQKTFTKKDKTGKVLTTNTAGFDLATAKSL